jgi:hypothetical protein
MRCFCVVQKQKGVADAVIEAVQRTLQTPGGHRRHPVAGSLCLGDAADEISGDQEDPSAPHRDRHGYQSATLYGLVVGGATLENVPITFRPISTGGVIRQQHHFINAL